MGSRIGGLLNSTFGKAAEISIFEVAMFALVAALYALISLDGEAGWLEGLLLCAFYLIVAFSAFFTPT